jgi:hypothetical protein
VASLRFALLGAGFWSRYQLAGWRELGGIEGADVDCVALYNRTRFKAEALARVYGVPAVYDDEVGEPFRANLLYANSYPVFENQPYLRERERVETQEGSLACTMLPYAVWTLTGQV